MSVLVSYLFVLCSFPLRPDAAAASDTCRGLADTAVRDAKGNYWYRCPKHAGMLPGGLAGEVVTHVPVKA